ncbi:HEPN [compost metagenome]
MDINAFRTQLELDWDWRWDELKLLKNMSSNLNLNQGDIYRRSLVVFLYAHFEGFFQFALTHYIETINDQNIPCSQANTHLISATLSGVFKALRDDNAKCDFFRNDAPEDTKLHRFYRENQFIENSSDIFSRCVQIQTTCIDLESNLSPVVFKKNLYKLGLPYELDREVEGHLLRLKNIRNKIAHGERKEGVNINEYEGFENSVIRTITSTMANLTVACNDKLYLNESFRT